MPPADGRCEGRSFGRHFFVALGNAAAHQIAQPINGLVSNPVVHAGAPAFPDHDAVLGHVRQMARHIGQGKTRQLRQLADAFFMLAQQIQDLQPRGL